MTRSALLDDHRQFGMATLVALVALALPLTAALLLAGRAPVIGALWLGVAIAAADVVLLMRGVSRFGGLLARMTNDEQPKRATGGLMSRFVAVAVLLGLAMAARTVNPIAVLAGFLLLPAALVTVGCVAIRRSTGDGGAGRRHFAR